MARKLSQLIQVGALGASAIILGGLVGCTAEIDTEPDRVERIETTRVERPAPPPPVVVRERDPYPERYPQPDRPEALDRRGVPRDAVMLQEGAGSIGVRANQSGTLYLYDIEEQRVVWSGQILRGDRFSLDSDANSAALNGRIVYRDDSVRRNRHRIFIDVD